MAQPAHEPTRRHPRQASRIAAQLSTLDPERDPATGAPCFRSSQELCINLSLGGASFQTREPLAAGRRVLVELRASRRAPIDLVGRVAWTRIALEHGDGEPRFTLGVEWSSAAPRQRAALRRLLRGLERASRAAAGDLHGAAHPGPGA